MKHRPNRWEVIWAFHVPLDNISYPVDTNCGTIYANTHKISVGHGPGDFIICPDLNGQPDLSRANVINGNKFVKMYDMRAFPGLVKVKSLDDVTTPKPESIIGNISKINYNLDNCAKKLVYRFALHFGKVFNVRLGEMRFRLKSKENEKTYYEAFVTAGNKIINIDVEFTNSKLFDDTIVDMDVSYGDFLGDRLINCAGTPVGEEGIYMKTINDAILHKYAVELRNKSLRKNKTYEQIEVEIDRKERLEKQRIRKDLLKKSNRHGLFGIFNLFKR